MRLVLLLLNVLLSAVACTAADRTYFRSDHGVVDGKPLPADFGLPHSVWRTPLNSGISSPCVHGRHVFLTTWNESKSQLATVALDRETGRLLWQNPVKTNYIEPVHRVGSPAACTPACDGERVYSFFGSYGLLCYTLDGRILWSRKMGPFQDEFGASSSPILVDDFVILNEDHDVECQLMAFDRLTGQPRWTAPRDDHTRSYSTPVLFETSEERSLLVAGSLRLTAYDIATGKPKWWVDGLSRIVDPTPVVADGRIFLATWTPGGDSSSRIAMAPYAEALETYDENSDQLIAKSELSEGPVLQRFFRIDLNQDEKLSQSEWEAHARVFELAQNVALSIEPRGDGDLTETSIRWTYRRGLPTVPSSVVYHGLLYMVKDSGIVTVLDATNGDLVSQGRARGRGNYYASLVAGDGKVYMISERGVMTVLEAGSEWKILSSHDFGERILATPVIRDGQMFLRSDEAVYCYAPES